MSTLYKFRCRCLGQNGIDQCDKRTTRKSVTCKDCDIGLYSCKAQGRKLVKKTFTQKWLVGERSR